MSLEKRILEVVEKKGEATLSELYAALPEYPRHSVRSKASILVKNGLLRKAGKGVYVLSDKRVSIEDTRPAGEDGTREPSAEAAAEDTSSHTSTDKDRDEFRRRVLRLLRRQPDATPEELAEVLEVDKGTVRNIIGELIDQGELEPPTGEKAGSPAEEKNEKTIRSAGCFYALVCRDIPGMRRVCEARGSLLCEQQNEAKSTAVS